MCHNCYSIIPVLCIAYFAHVMTYIGSLMLILLPSFPILGIVLEGKYILLLLAEAWPEVYQGFRNDTWAPYRTCAHYRACTFAFLS